MRHSAISLPAVIKVYLKKKKGVSSKQKERGSFFSKNWGFDTLRDREKHRTTLEARFFLDH